MTAGPSHALAMDAPVVNASIGGGSIINAGGNVSVQGGHNTSVGKGASEPDAAAWASRATPRRSGSHRNASVNSFVAAGAVLASGGNISITANSNNAADAEAHSFFGGGFGAGTSDPTTVVDAKTLAHMDGTITGGLSLTILAQTSTSAPPTAPRAMSPSPAVWG